MLEVAEVAKWECNWFSFFYSCCLATWGGRSIWYGYRIYMLSNICIHDFSGGTLPLSLGFVLALSNLKGWAAWTAVRPPEWSCEDSETIKPESSPFRAPSHPVPASIPPPRWALSGPLPHTKCGCVPRGAVEVHGGGGDSGAPPGKRGCRVIFQMGENLEVILQVGHAQHSNRPLWAFDGELSGRSCITAGTRRQKEAWLEPDRRVVNAYQEGTPSSTWEGSMVSF